MGVINKPLTDDERQLAEEHHGLLVSFLGRGGFSRDDWYDVLAFGYLFGVQRHSRGAPYALGTNCYRDMKQTVAEELRFRSREKRSAKTLSLDAEIPDTDGLTLGDFTADPAQSDPVLSVDSAILCETLLGMATPLERKLVCALASGRTLRETAAALGISNQKSIRALDGFRMRVYARFPQEFPEKERVRFARKTKSARHLTTLIKASGSNVKNISRRAGLSHRAIRFYMQGHNMPTPENMQKLADALGVSLESMYPPAGKAETAPGQRRRFQEK
jgi:RNA polymerase sigma-70 factor (ECF subfamily)